MFSFRGISAALGGPLVSFLYLENWVHRNHPLVYPAICFSRFGRNEFRVPLQMETSRRHGSFGKTNEIIWKFPARARVPSYTVQPSITSCRCKCRHAFPAMDGDPGEENFTASCADECAIWRTFLPFALSFLWPALFLLNDPFFVHRVRASVHASRIHAPWITR